MKSLKNIFLIFVSAFLFPMVMNAQQALSLNDAVRLALENNPEIKANALEVDKSKEGKTIARADYLPAVYAGAQAAHFFNRVPFFGFGNEGSSDKIPYGRFGGEDQLSAAVTASQSIYNPHALANIRYARLQERQSEVELSRTRNNTLSQVRLTYLQLLVLAERLKIQEESIRRNQRALSDARSLYLQGKALRVDTLRTYTAVKNREPDILRLQYLIKTTELQLKTLTGLDADLDIQLTDSLYIPGPGSIPDEEDVYEIAKHNNPRYQLLALQKVVSDKRAEVASALRLPELSAVGQYQVQSQTNNLEYRSAYYPTSSFVGLQLTIPLFNGFATQSKVKQAHLESRQSEIRKHYGYEQLRSEVNQVLAEAHESQDRLRTSTIVQETARASYDIIQYRYKNGLATRLELTDAEFELHTAQSNYLEAVYDYLSARIRLANLMGETE